MTKVSIFLAILSLASAAPQNFFPFQNQGFAFSQQQPLALNQNLGFQHIPLSNNVNFGFVPAPAIAASAPLKLNKIPSQIVINAKKIDPVPAVEQKPEPEEDETPAPALYSYSYQVNDVEYSDHKGHSESRDGDSVSGKYTVVEPDGNLRIVTYTADAINGFRATVDRQPSNAPAPVKPVRAPAKPLVLNPAPVPAPVPAPSKPEPVPAKPIVFSNQIPLNAVHVNQIPINAVPVPANQVTLNSVQGNQIPFNQFPFNRIPINQLAFNQIPTNQLALNSVPAKQVVSNPVAIGQSATTITWTSPYGNYAYTHA